jgi:sec-independent protein translocase protein TatA
MPPTQGVPHAQKQSIDPSATLGTWNYRCRSDSGTVHDVDVGAPELIIILVVILVLFGGAKLPQLARSLGQAQTEFRKGLREGHDPKPDDKADEAEPGTAGKADGSAEPGSADMAEPATPGVADTAEPGTADTVEPEPGVADKGEPGTSV